MARVLLRYRALYVRWRLEVLVLIISLPHRLLCLVGRQISEGLLLESDLKQDVSISKCGVNQDLHTTFILGSSWSVIEQIIYIYI